MLFNSFIFLFFFLPITILLYYLVPKKLRNILLLFASILFYMWGEPVYILIMLFSTIFDYINGILISYFRQKNYLKLTRVVLIISIIGNLGILGFFKYGIFLIKNIETIFNITINYSEIIMPIGISFYTFQTMSYTIDVYKDEVPVQKNILDFATYVLLFPQLIAGPIVKYQDVYQQLKNRQENVHKMSYGIKRFIIGLFKKAVLANSIGEVFQMISLIPIRELSFVTAWLGVLSYTFQIYFDFSGYSDMAIGLGKMFGFTFKENFCFPYLAESITDFWRRWHISLSSWFKEYVYIPLGGNKKHPYRNLLIVWFLTGLWHGASWNFVAWGLYFGFLLIFEKKFWLKTLQKLPKLIQHIYTMFFVMIGWVFFFSPDLTYAFQYLSKMFSINTTFLDSYSLYMWSTNLILIAFCVFMSTDILSKVIEHLKKLNCYMACSYLGYLVIFFLTISFLAGATYNPFLYFRF